MSEDRVVERRMDGSIRRDALELSKMKPSIKTNWYLNRISRHTAIVADELKNMNENLDSIARLLVQQENDK